jgi:hypothetical protein
MKAVLTGGCRERREVGKLSLLRDLRGLLFKRSLFLVYRERAEDSMKTVFTGARGDRGENRDLSSCAVRAIRFG